MYLESNYKDYDMRLKTMIKNSHGVPFDYRLYVQSRSGSECTIEEANKYCAYTEHGGFIGKDIVI